MTLIFDNSQFCNTEITMKTAQSMSANGHQQKRPPCGAWEGIGLQWEARAERSPVPAGTCRVWSLVSVTSPMGMPAQQAWLTGALHRSQSHPKSTSAWSWQDLRETHVLATRCSSLQEGCWSGHLNIAQMQLRLCYLLHLSGIPSIGWERNPSWVFWNKYLLFLSMLVALHAFKTDVPLSALTHWIE